MKFYSKYETLYSRKSKMHLKISSAKWCLFCPVKHWHNIHYTKHKCQLVLHITLTWCSMSKLNVNLHCLISLIALEIKQCKSRSRMHFRFIPPELLLSLMGLIAVAWLIEGCPFSGSSNCHQGVMLLYISALMAKITLMQKSEFFLHKSDWLGCRNVYGFW